MFGLPTLTTLPGIRGEKVRVSGVDATTTSVTTSYFCLVAVVPDGRPPAARRRVDEVTRGDCVVRFFDISLVSIVPCPCDSYGRRHYTIVVPLHCAAATVIVSLAGTTAESDVDGHNKLFLWAGSPDRTLGVTPTIASRPSIRVTLFK